MTCMPCINEHHKVLDGGGCECKCHQPTPSETKPFDPTKPVQLRDGTPARVICVDRRGQYPIVAVSGGDDRITTHRSGGEQSFGLMGPRDLINIPPATRKVEVWVNWYNKSGNPRGVYTIKNAADAAAAAWPCIARKHFTLTLVEGEGL